MKYLLGSLLLLVSICNAQIIFNETIFPDTGGVSGDLISTHQTNNRFDTTNLVFSGSGIIRSTLPNIAADYVQASNGFNIELDNTATFIIDGITATGLDNLYLSFGLRKDIILENGNSLNISYSTTGINGDFTSILWDKLPTGTGTVGWYYRTSLQKIPNTVTTIKFKSHANDWRIDDFILQTGIPLLVVKSNLLRIIPDSEASVENRTDFESNTSNYGFKTHTFTLENKGNSDLIISSITVDNTIDFSIENNTPLIVSKNASTSFTITFKPQSLGDKTSLVKISSNDHSNPDFVFKIKGKSVSETQCNTINTTLKTQNFETNSDQNWNYSIIPNTGISLAGNFAYGTSGERANSPLSFQNKSLQVNNSSTTLLFDSVDTSDYANLSFQFNLGSYSTTAGNGSDVEDFVSVYISTNGGETWKHQLQVTGYNNARWSLTSGIATAKETFGNNLILFRPTSGGYKTTDGFGNVTITNLPSVTNLKIQVVITNDKENEIWALDNFTLTGTKPDIRYWENNSWSNSDSSIANAHLVINDSYNTKTNGAISACSCVINEGKKLVIEEGDFLSLHGGLTINGDFLVQNNGSFIQKNDFAINSGKGHFRRFSTPMKKFDYTYWSSPVVNQILESFSYGSIFYEYSPQNNNWIKASGIMNPGKGYIIRASDNIDYTNGNVSFNGDFYGIPNNGKITTTIDKTNSKWNLVGNPYPSAIDADLFLNHTSNTSLINGTIYLWTHATGLSNVTSGEFSKDDYASYNQTGGVAAVNGSAVPNGFIASGQGFFVEGLENGTLEFNNSMRIAAKNTQFFRQKNNSHKSRLWLEMSNTKGAYKQILVGYINGATNALDRNFDGKAKKSATSIRFYSIAENQELSIQGRQYPFDLNDEIVLGFTSEIEGDFELKIANSDGDLSDTPVFITDHLAEITHDLTKNGYLFSTKKGSFNNRFTLRYTNNETLDLDSEVEGNHTENSIIAISKEALIEISSINKISLSEIRLFNTFGQLLYSNTNTSDEYRIAIPKSNTVVFIQTKINGQKTITTKLIH